MSESQEASSINNETSKKEKTSKLTNTNKSKAYEIE